MKDRLNFTNALFCWDWDPSRLGVPSLYFPFVRHVEYYLFFVWDSSSWNHISKNVEVLVPEQIGHNQIQLTQIWNYTIVDGPSGQMMEQNLLSNLFSIKKIWIWTKGVGPHFSNKGRCQKHPEGGGPSNFQPKAAKPWPPLKILRRTCTLP